MVLYKFRGLIGAIKDEQLQQNPYLNPHLNMGLKTLTRDLKFGWALKFSPQTQSWLAQQPRPHPALLLATTNARAHRSSPSGHLASGERGNGCHITGEHCRPPAADPASASPPTTTTSSPTRSGPSCVSAWERHRLGNHRQAQQLAHLYPVSATRRTYLPSASTTRCLR